MAILSVEVSPFTAPNFDVFAPSRHQDPRGVIVGAPLDGGQSYTPWIGLSTVRELALANADRVGLVPVETRDALEAQLDDAVAEIRALQDRVADLEATQERVAGLVADGFTVVKKQGRVPKKENV